MGRGKGNFDHWACRAPPNRVLFELGGGALREEMAKSILTHVGCFLPCPVEFVTRQTPPKLGHLVIPHPAAAAAAAAAKPVSLPAEQASTDRSSAPQAILPMANL